MTTASLRPAGPIVTPPSLSRSDWVIPTLLILLSLVPVIAGGLRLTGLFTDVEIMGAEARFDANPWPVVVHIISASTYTMLGAFQFSTGIRRNWPKRHRVAGRVLVLAGFAAAASGIWMVLVYPHPAEGSGLLGPTRLVFASATFGFLYLGLRAILKHDVTQHRAWMIRAYAIFIGAGTQVFVAIPYLLIFGEPDVATGDQLLIAGWLINIVFAEWVIRARPFATKRTRAQPAHA